MKVLLLHNRYAQPGGEDMVVEAEAALLERNGHCVERLDASNEGLAAAGWWSNARAAVGATWSRASKRRVSSMIQSFRPDVVHCHNTFPLLSPSVYYAARAAGVPVVQTLHNYRLLCLNALLYRSGKKCTDCVGRLPMPGIVHSCYRGSVAGSSAVALMITVHRQIGTWQRAIDRYIALSTHSKDQFVAGGLPSSLVSVKPNFVHPDPGEGQHRGNFALFVGRLAEEKGIRVLARAWEIIGDKIPLKIVGDGPLRGIVEETTRSCNGVHYEGYRPVDEVTTLMKDASLLVVPSVSDEHSPMGLLQALATGLPAIVSDHGALSEIVAGEQVGWKFPPGDAAALAEAVQGAWASTGSRIERGKAARAEFCRRYSAEGNYNSLMSIYDSAIAHRRVAMSVGAG